MQEKKKKPRRFKLLKPRLAIKKHRLTLERVFNSFAGQILRMFRSKTGLMGCAYLTFGFAGYSYVVGPYHHDSYHRFALAGTAATVAVEFLTHGIDTINMRSKAV